MKIFLYGVQSTSRPYRLSNVAYYPAINSWTFTMGCKTIIAHTMDNFLRPILIEQVEDMPLLQVYASVVQGAIFLRLV